MKFRSIAAVAAAAALLTAFPINALADEPEDDIQEETTEYVPEIPEDEQLVVFDADFEDGSTGKWVVFGGGGSVAVDSENAHSGSNSLKITGRKQTYSGPSVTGDSFITTGDVYYFDGWICHDSDGTREFSWTMKYIDGTGLIQYKSLGVVSAASGEWEHIGERVNIPSDATSISFYFECSNAATDFWVDDITIKGRTAANQEDSKSRADKKGIIVSYDFENNSDGWGTRGGERLIRTDDFAYTGSHSIYSTNREKTWNGPSINVDNILERGREYFFSAYVMYNGKEFEDAHKFRLEIEYTLDGNANYILITDKIIEKGKWTEISGFYTLPAGAENVRSYVQTDNPEEDVEPDLNDLLSFYVDNYSISDGAVVRRNAKIRSAVRIIVGIAIFAALAIAAVLVVKNLRKNKKALEAAARDSMTQALNRNTYEERMTELRSDPDKCRSLYFALCDVNFLKYINDNFGHKCGDEAIIRCGKLLIESVGYDGDVYRIGGDEFVCISRKPIKDKIIRAIETETAKKSEYPFAIAAGFTQYDEKLDGDSPDAGKMVDRCDQEMYEHKQRIKAENEEFSRK